MMKIYEYAGSPNSARIRITLAEKGFSDKVSFITVDVPAPERRKAILLAKHSFETTPLLVLDDGRCIGDCTAITEYLDHLKRTTTLIGGPGEDRARVHLMQRRVEAGLLDALTAHFYHAVPEPETGTRRSSHWDKQSRARVLASMRYLDGVLGDRPYLAGNYFSMADISAFVALIFAEFSKIERPASLGHLAAWRGRVAVRPSIAAAGWNWRFLVARE